MRKSRDMNKTKLQLYEELKELTEENRKQIKEILDDMVDSGVLATHTLNIPDCLNTHANYDITPEDLEERLNCFTDMAVSAFSDYCEHRGIFLHMLGLEDSEFDVSDYRASFNIAFNPQPENTLLGDRFYYVNFSHEETLREFIENYVEYKEAFTEYLCDNGYISADIYSDGFYELVTVEQLKMILTECKEFFSCELDKLKMLQTSLCECENKLREISNTFEHRFYVYLDEIGYRF